MAKIERVLVSDLDGLANVVSSSFNDICDDMNTLTKRVIKLETRCKRLGLLSLGIAGLLYLYNKNVSSLSLKVNEFENRIKVDKFVNDGEEKYDDLK